MNACRQLNFHIKLSRTVNNTLLSRSFCTLTLTLSAISHFMLLRQDTMRYLRPVRDQLTSIHGRSNPLVLLLLFCCCSFAVALFIVLRLFIHYQQQSIYFFLILTLYPVHSACGFSLTSSICISHFIATRIERATVLRANITRVMRE